MEFFNSAVTTLQTIVVGLGGALCVWGGINLLEGYGQDKQLCKLSAVQAMKLTKMHQKLLLPYLICN